MSKFAKTTHILKPGEVSKKIVSKPQKTRSSAEWFDDLGKYRDEHVAEYEDKKNDFMKAANAYNKMNVDTQMSRKVRLHANYEEMLNLDFLKEKERVEEEECMPLCCCPKCEPNKTGQLLRKRNIRDMTCIEEPKPQVCLLEPWFKRYLILNKFIWAGRTVIIQNRLLKVLDKLRKLTLQDVREIEKAGITKNCTDFHCHPVFLKFL